MLVGRLLLVAADEMLLLFHHGCGVGSRSGRLERSHRRPVVVLLEVVAGGSGDGVVVRQALVHAAHHLDLLHVATLAHWRHLLVERSTDDGMFVAHGRLVVCLVLAQRADLWGEVYVHH